LLALAAGEDQGLAGDPAGGVRGHEDRGFGDVGGLGDAAERSGLLDLPAELAFGDAAGVEPFGFHHAGVQGVDADLLRTEFEGQGDRDGVYGGLRCAIDAARGHGHGADDGTDVDDGAAFGADVLDGFLDGEEEAEDVEAELLVEVVNGDGFQGGELIDARVVDEDIDAAEGFLGGGEECLNLRGVRDIGLYGLRLASGGGDAFDDGIG
jgi:hypothetical protein